MSWCGFGERRHHRERGKWPDDNCLVYVYLDFPGWGFAPPQKYTLLVIERFSRGLFVLGWIAKFMGNYVACWLKQIAFYREVYCGMCAGKGGGGGSEERISGECGLR